MRIADLLHTQSIDLNFTANSKREAINKLVDLMNATGNLSNKEDYKKAILAREELSTTGIGEGIAIPHAKVSAVKEATLAAATSKKGIDYESLDGAPANLFFMIAAPEGANNTHLDVLARLSTLLMDADFRKSLIEAEDKNEFVRLINIKETEKFGDEAVVKEDKAPSKNNDGYQVLAVTACPTGIAHTFMAAESLSNKAKDMGITLKVETNGSSGVKNALTKEEIKKADCIIVAADKNVEMARFDGKKVIITKVADGIHKAEELLTNARDGKAPVYHAKEGSSYGTSGDSETQTSEGIGRVIYKHLMNGVSHMLPFVIGGGLLIAIAFLIDSSLGYKLDLGMNNPVAAWFKTMGGHAFGFMLPVLAGYIAMSIGERPALAVGFVGGYLANLGGSGFLGALIAGFVAGYLMLGLKKVFSYLPDSLEGLKPTLLYPLFGLLLICLIISFVVNPPVAYVNNALTSTLLNMGQTSSVLVGIILATMMAIDMGGPINKAAYVVGIAALEAGNTSMMAAVMIGGMVPPLAIAIATTIFRNKFTQRERESGIVNYIMGLSFITEGAIPFAASDPLRVIPASAIGAAVSGAIAMVFKCTLNAPHGGLFVVPVIGNPLGYLAALAAGSIVGALILGFLKKPIE